GGGQLVNTGTIETSNGGSLSLSCASWSNAHTLRANDGTLTLEGAWMNSGTIGVTNAIVNLGGTIALAALGEFNRSGGTVNLTGVLDLKGETLTLDASTGPWIVNGGTMRSGKV